MCYLKWREELNLSVGQSSWKHAQSQSSAAEWTPMKWKWTTAQGSKGNALRWWQCEQCLWEASRAKATHFLGEALFVRRATNDHCMKSVWWLIIQPFCKRMRICPGFARRISHHPKSVPGKDAGCRCKSMVQLPRQEDLLDFVIPLSLEKNLLHVLSGNFYKNWETKIGKEEVLELTFSIMLPIVLTPLF